jgi:hypothetical protein
MNVDSSLVWHQNAPVRIITAAPLLHSSPKPPAASRKWSHTELAVHTLQYISNGFREKLEGISAATYMDRRSDVIVLIELYAQGTLSLLVKEINTIFETHSH